MAKEDIAVQEPRIEQATFRVTAGEKADIRFLAAALGTTESDLIHGRVIAEIRAEAARIRGQLGISDVA